MAEAAVLSAGKRERVTAETLGLSITHTKKVELVVRVDFRVSEME